MPGWLQFEFVRNPGAVFGIAPGQRGAFLVVSAAAIAFLTYLFAGSGGRWFYQVVLGVLLAGVLGNMYDRVVYGSVRDMIHAVPGWHWPAGVHRALHFLPVGRVPVHLQRRRQPALRRRGRDAGLQLRHHPAGPSRPARAAPAAAPTP